MLAFIGCSGFFYREWRGHFYPTGLPSSKWLDYYCQHFNTIEINASFYRMPTRQSLSVWYRQTPRDFVLTLKAPRLFTHFRKMRGILSEQASFYDIALDTLQDKLCCILYQFPAQVQYSEQMLEVIMTLSDYPVLHAIEFRHPSWWREDVYQALHAVGMLFVNVSFPGIDDLFVPDEVSTYLRFHGKPVLYKSGYGIEGLSPWIEVIKAHPPRQLFAYFNNTWYTEAISDARFLRSAIADIS